MKSVIQVWKNKALILEGIKNNLFKSEEVEAIAKERAAICERCPSIDRTGEKCIVPGTGPCCGECGCSLKLKLRSLSSSCGDEKNPRWNAIVTPEDEDEIKRNIGYKDE